MTPRVDLPPASAQKASTHMMLLEDEEDDLIIESDVEEVRCVLFSCRLQAHPVKC